MRGSRSLRQLAQGTTGTFMGDQLRLAAALFVV